MSDAATEWVLDVDEASFEQAVLERSREVPVVVDFWAPWCEPCRQLGPLLEALARERQGDFLLAKVNLDTCQQLAYQFGIEVVPAVRAFRDGQMVLGFDGLLPEEQLRAFAEQISPTPADRLARQAKALEADNPEQAERLYQQALELDAHHGVALLGRVRVLLARNQDAEAAELLGSLRVGDEDTVEVERLERLLAVRQLGRAFGDEAEARRRLEAEPNNAERRYELGCVLATAGRYPEALQTLLEAAESNPNLARTKVREAMVQIFHVIGVRDPLADDYRDKLSRLLY